MLAPTFALMNRTLCEDARSIGSSLGRAGVVLLSVLIVLGIDLIGWTFGAPGLVYFEWLLCFDFLLIFGIAAALSSAITEEKEARMLGLLRMARVGPLALLFGKSTARLLQILLLLTLQFPFMLLAVTLGGVAVVQVVAAYCSLVALMIFVANLALLASVVSPTSQSAFAVTVVALAGLCALTSGGQIVLDELAFAGFLTRDGALYARLSAAAEAVWQCGPIAAYRAITSTAFTGPVIGLQVLSNTLAGVAFFLIAWRSLDFFAREDAPAGALHGSRIRRRRMLSLFAPGRAWTHALAWKDFHFVTGGKLGQLIQFVVHGLIIVVFYACVEDGMSRRLSVLEQLGTCAMACMLIVLAVFGIMIALEVLQHELTSKTLDGLLLLPISPRRLLYEKLAGCSTVLIPPATYLLSGAVLHPRLVATTMAAPYPWFFIVDYVFFFYVTLYTAMYSKKDAATAFLLVLVAHVGGGCLFGADMGDAFLPPLLLLPLGGLLICGIRLLHELTLELIGNREVQSLDEPWPRR